VCEWLVERNILNHHFKGVTIISGWDRVSTKGQQAP
jgi:hypothetical protein